jgi:hypothetical protein
VETIDIRLKRSVLTGRRYSLSITAGWQETEMKPAWERQRLPDAGLLFIWAGGIGAFLLLAFSSWSELLPVLLTLVCLLTGLISGVVGIASRTSNRPLGGVGLLVNMIAFAYAAFIVYAIATE